ncbi:hypothetical protein O181_036859 [Austropuccinia psidii MF-1]|uniref:Chromo domain-containing protein n=1 Tax=Austropuccinia psidii MF-1 TaxID=1389203 RepID=A0A9Q3D5G2_9BASI|nr:hypothetical protein [Austropuccinia psidii MF-1]
MNQLLTTFNSSTIFSKIDLRGAYSLLRIKEGAENLTSFRAKYGSYEYLVMPFGLTNAPDYFQNLVNDVFSELLDTFIVVYLDDIMVLSNSEEEHVRNVASVLQILRDNNLFSKASKCVLHASSVEYLGYVVSSDGLKIDSSKFQQILNCPQPKNIKALQSFLGFTNFYCCFIKITLKKSLLSLPSSKKTLLLSSMRELLAHWDEVLSEFHFTITYFPGRLGTLPVALSHQDNVYPERGVDFISKNHQDSYQVIKQDGIQESILFSIKAEIFSDLVEQIQKEVWQDKFYKEILKQLARNESVSDYTLEPQAKLLLFKDRVVLPRNEEIQLNILQTLWLASKNIKTKRPTEKLAERWLGPFEVLKMIGSHAYHLRLPQQWKSFHHVFHVSLLEPVKKSSIPNKNQLPPPPILVEEQEEWEVAQVLVSKLKRGKLWHLLKWKGFSEDPGRTTWEPAPNLTSSPDLVRNFHSLYPGKPGPNTPRA